MLSKNILVVGASRGIGGAVAQHFHQQGHHTLLAFSKSLKR